MTPVPDEPTPPSLSELALGFARLGILGFGGVGPQVRHALVVERRWLTEAEFVEVMSLGQALPGPNVGNLAAIVGDRWHGPPGAAVAVLALTLPSTLVAIALAAAVVPIEREPHVLAAERMITGAVAGLMAALGLRVIGARRGPDSLRAFALAAAVVAAVVGLRAPLALAVALLVPLGMLMDRGEASS